MSRKEPKPTSAPEHDQTFNRAAEYANLSGEESESATAEPEYSAETEILKIINEAEDPADIHDALAWAVGEGYLIPGEDDSTKLIPAEGNGEGEAILAAADTARARLKEIANREAHEQAGAALHLNELADELARIPSGTGPEAERLRDESLQAVLPRYEASYPNELHAIHALAELVRSTDDESIINEMNEKTGGNPNESEKAQIIEKVVNLAESQFMLTNFVIQNAGDEALMAKFWDATEAATKERLAGFADRSKAGVLGAAATYLAFEAIGKAPPSLSMPRQDAREKIDLWSRPDQAVQIKSYGKGDELIIIKTNDLDFPGVEVSGDDQKKRHFSRLSAEFKKFVMKIDQYNKGREEKDKIEGYFIEIPAKLYDQNTGVPKPRLIEDLRQRMAELEQARAEN